MLLYTMCLHCKEETPVKSKASTRPDLEKEKGEKFVVQCKNCLTNNEKHVNDILAKSNPTILLAGLAIGIVVAYFMWNFVGLLSTIVLGIPVIISQQQNKSVHAFNGYRIHRN